MNIFLWIAQAALAAMFLMAGFMKISKSKSQLMPMLPWTKDFSAGMIKFIGISELLGAIGVILPMAFRLYERLTPLAAIGLGLVMILASSYHIKHKEYAALKITIPLLALVAIVVVGRYSLINF